VAVLSAGRVLQTGTVQDLHAAPATVHVARLLGGFAELPGNVGQGVHRGPGGAIALPPGCPVPDGPATLLVHRQAVDVHAARPGRAGPGVQDGHTLTGVVTRVRSAGLQRRVSVTLGPAGGRPGTEPTLEADLPEPADGDQPIALGERVVLRVAVHGTWAVASSRADEDEHAPSMPEHEHSDARSAGPA
jgi:putative spermidine/putrescine transport system ATP-binding protein